MPFMPGIVTSDSTRSISPLRLASISSASAPFDRGAYGESACLEHARDRLPRRVVIVHHQDRLAGGALRRVGHAMLHVKKSS